MNTRYGRLVDGRIEYAPDVLNVGGVLKVNPTEESYLAAGWRKVADEPPAPEEGKEAIPSGWEEVDGTLRRVYRMVDLPPERTPQSVPPPGGGEAGARVFSKLKLVTALKEADKWVLVKTWLEEKSYYDYYLAAQDFREDHPLFTAAVAALKEYARIGDGEIEAILSASVAD